MSIFGSILSKIMGTGAKAATPAAPTTAAPAAPVGTAAPSASASAAAKPASPAGPITTAAAKPAAAAGSAVPVDVNAVLTEMASHQGQKLDWKHSIVDLMKLLDLDSSLSSRKELAKELAYTGSTDDSAAMNIWLHRQVMHKLAENGGKVPEELKV